MWPPTDALATDRGLLVTDHLHRFPDDHATVAPWLADGKMLVRLD